MSMTFAEFVIDERAAELRRNGQVIKVEPQVFDLIVFLASNPGRILTKDDIVQSVWHGRAISDSAISTRINAARRALGDDGATQRFIKTVHGRGFRFEPKPAVETDRQETALVTEATGEARTVSTTPPIRYAKSGAVHIAYQVMGRGPPDLVVVMGFISHLDLGHENPWLARLLDRLASFSRLILFDKRGTGLSDRVSAIPTLEERMDDVRAVMDAAGSNRAALFGFSEGGPMSILFAATYPDRVSALILHAAMARMAWAPDNPWGRTEAELESRCKLIEANWGAGEHFGMYAQGLADNDVYRKWFARFERGAASPEAAQALLRMNMLIDVRHVLPVLSVPTLITHRTGDPNVNVQNGRYLARHIQEAKYVELPGDDHAPWAGNIDALCDQFHTFLIGVRAGPEPDRVLATVLFAGIVDATAQAAEMGHRAWTELLREYSVLVRRQLQQYRGRENGTAGDGFSATFDGPTRAIHCGRAIAGALVRLNLKVRTGVHTGECEVVGENLGGIAVKIGAQVMSHAEPGEILVSSTVKDLVAGSGHRFMSRGLYVLGGGLGEWNLFSVE